MLHSRAANRVALLGALLVFGLILNRWFGPVLRQPNEYLLGAHGDGLKNYYTLAYYLRYDAGAHFTGMNYPFGEQIVFTDNQPLLAFVGRAAQRLGLPVASHAVGLINLLMLLGQFLTVTLLFLIGRRALLPGWFAGALAVLITLLTPQHDRLLGHYGLAYSFAFPAIWYCLLRVMSATEPHPWRWTGIYVLVTTLAGLLHPYHLLLGTMFAAASVLVWGLRRLPAARPAAPGSQTSPARRFWLHRPWLRLLLAVALPIVLFQGWVRLTSAVTDRPASPFGFLVYHSTWQSVFLPAHGPLRVFWQAAFHSADPSGEGIAYVGLVAGVVAVLLLGRLLGHLLRGRWRRALRPAEPAALQASGWAAVLVLLFACAYPFRWGLEGLINYLGPLRQFRGLGRFAWVFYYVFGIYAGFYLHLLFRYLRQRRAAPVGYGLLLLAAAVWGAEGWVYFSERGGLARKSLAAHELLNPARPFTEWLALGGRAATDFQAILPLPYYHVGSEKFDIFRSEEATEQSMKASLELHLPIAAAMLSRTSTSQSLALVQLLSNPLLAKEVLHRFPSAKPLLIIANREVREPAELALLARARLVFDSPRLQLYELPLTAFASTAPAALARFAARRDSLRPGPAGLLLAGTNQAVHHLDFAGEPSGAATFGSPGSLHGQGLRELLRTELPADTAGYEVSVWCWAKAGVALPALYVQQQAPGGSLVLLTQESGMRSTDVAGEWVRVRAVVQPQPAGGPVSIWLDREDFVADELLLRPRRTAVYQSRPDGSLWLNNFPLSSAAPPLAAPPLAASR